MDTTGLLLIVMVSAANLPDRHTARSLLPLLRAAQQGIRLIWADGGYLGALPNWAKTTLHLTMAVVKKIAGQANFVVVPRRWVVARTFSRICQAHRNVRDYGSLVAVQQPISFGARYDST